MTVGWGGPNGDMGNRRETADHEVPGSGLVEASTDRNDLSILWRTFAAAISLVIQASASSKLLKR